jgi:hypothetical protein
MSLPTRHGIGDELVVPHWPDSQTVGNSFANFDGKSRYTTETECAYGLSARGAQCKVLGILDGDGGVLLV